MNLFHWERHDMTAWKVSAVQTYVHNNLECSHMQEQKSSVGTGSKHLDSEQVHADEDSW